MLFRQLFDQDTWTYTYLLADETSKEAVLIDPVREQVERDTQLLDELGLTLKYTLETHVHADHVTGGGQLRKQLGSAHVVSTHGGAQGVDVAVDDGDVLMIGDVELKVLATPGHTDGCISLLVPSQGMVFTGDALFIRGCGRTDFQQGSAETLYESIHNKIFSLPDNTKVFPGHDYKGRTMSTVGEEKAFNPRLGGGKSQADFIAIMDGLNLAPPKKLDEAVPANLRCGIEEDDGDADGMGFATWAPTFFTSGVPEVEAHWVAAEGARHRVVDVRTTQEFNDELGHIPGAENVVLNTLPHAAQYWDRGDGVVVVCRSGIRSAQAALLLMSMGFEKVASLSGGMMAWSEAGLPVSA